MSIDELEFIFQLINFNKLITYIKNEKMKVILNCLPPLETAIVSAAMSILQAFLKQHSIDVETKYWNILFSDKSVLDNFQIPDRDVLSSLPFLSHIAIQHDAKEILEMLESKLQASNPQYINMSKTYYAELLVRLADGVNNTFVSELKTMNIEECILFGISAKNLQWISGNILAKLVKQINPNIKIVIGGFGTKREALAIMQNFDMYDYAVWGEGEYALLGLYRHLENPIENPVSGVQHLVYRENNTLQTTKVQSEYVDLNGVNPDFSSYFSQQKYTANSIIPIEGGRGCHWRKCKFCFLNSGYRNRCKNAENIVAFMKFVIEKYNGNRFDFVDSDLVYNNLQSFEELLDLLIELRQDYPSFSIINAEIITKGLNAGIIKKMSFAGIKATQIGYEALNDNLLRKINKKNTVSSNILFIKWARQFNIDIEGANIITNLIDETDTDIIGSIKNLHFLRFYLQRGHFQHITTSLAISSSSPYYKLLETNNLLEKWNRNEIIQLLPKTYINDKTNKYDISLFQKETKNSLWEYFFKVEKYYLDNSYQYLIVEKDSASYLYREYYNSTLIKQLELEKDSLYWKILHFCNCKVVSKQEVMECFNNFSQEVEDTIRELFDEYLLYANEDLTEIVSLINTDIIHH
jgi:radical SAM superfamily enzyme YgiQ (UPF0313 family)